MKIIMLAGLMCAGKTTVAELFTKMAHEVGFLATASIKFADPIHAIQRYIYQIAGMDPVKNRDLMQSLGDAVRNTVAKDYYVRVMEHSIQQARYNGTEVVIVDDLRMPLEMDLAKKLGAVTVLVMTPDAIREKRGKELGIWSGLDHATETSLPIGEFDYTIKNNDDMVDLELQVRELWAKITKEA